jgi:hypothetical protein
MRKIFIDETKASVCSGYALASNYAVDEKDAAYVSLADIIDILQNEANTVAGDLLSQELTSTSPENEFDRRYYIGRWDKLNELINLFKN